MSARAIQFTILSFILALGLVVRVDELRGKYGDAIQLSGASREYQILAEHFDNPGEVPPPGNMPGFSLLLSALYQIVPLEHAQIQVGTSLFMSVLVIWLTYLVASRIVSGGMALIVAFLASINGALVENAPNGMPEEYFCVSLLFLLLAYLRVLRQGRIETTWCVVVGLLGALLFSIRSDAAAVLAPIAIATFVMEFRIGSLRVALAKHIPIVGLPVAAALLSGWYMSSNDVVESTWRAGRGFFYQEFLRGRMPWEYMFYSRINVADWWFGYHDLAEMFRIVSLSSARTVLSMGETLGGQLLLIVTGLGMYWFVRERRDFALPLVVPLCLLPQFLWVYFQPDDDLNRYMARALPVVLIFVGIGLQGVCQRVVNHFGQVGRREIALLPAYISAGVLAVLLSAIPYSLYRLALPALSPVEYFKHHQSAKRIHFELQEIGFIVQKRNIRKEVVLSRINALIDENPVYAPTYYAAAIVYYVSGEFDEAIGHLETALEIVPYYAEAGELLAELYIRRGELEKASEVVEGLIKRRPDFTVSYLLAGQIHAHNRRFGLAIDSFQRYLSANREQHRGALEREVRVFQRDGHPPEYVAESRENLANIERPEFGLFTDGLWSFMTEGLNGLVAGRPMDSNLYHVLALLYLHTQDFDMAKRHLMIALELSPDVDALNDLAVVLFLQGEHERSGEVLREALVEHPASGLLWMNAGNIHVLNRDWPMALASFDEAAKIDSGNSYSSNMSNLIRNEEKDRAVQRATQNMRISPNEIALPLSKFVLGTLSSS